MTSYFEDLFVVHGDPVFSEFYGETITRRIKGSGTITEQIDGVIVEKDIGATSLSEGGFIIDDRGQKSVRNARVHIPADKNVNEYDVYEIDNELWEVVGVQIGEDKSRKTVFCKLNRSQTMRRPRTQR
tara:strand:- start:2943 stop:3326 length:384 start_codon:yes stop_codon:yes gene_type:complete